MNAVTLTNYQIWDELAKLLAPINIDRLATQHLESCNYKIRGYWDSNNKFYEEIALTNPIYAELIGRSLGTNITNNHPTSHWIKLKFLLKADRTVGENTAFFKYVRYTKKVRTRHCRVPTGLLNVLILE
ncbi:MAG: hypothetical protein HC941_12680 [Microcoleus sp. SU_5_3]|nr:hypothetical protein [Microcoleus sp. SU_5_3]